MMMLLLLLLVVMVAAARRLFSFPDPRILWDAGNGSSWGTG